MDLARYDSSGKASSGRSGPVTPSGSSLPGKWSAESLRDSSLGSLLLSANFFSVDNKKMKDILMSRNRKEAIYNLLVFLIFVFVLTFFMRFLWNKTLVKYISVLKPVDSLWHTFLLALGISLFKL
jgi:hypothetical protein